MARYIEEANLKEIIKSHFDIKNIENHKITTTGKNLLNLAMRINEFAMNTAFEQYMQIGEKTGNESLDEEIEKTIKMNDMWCGLMPNTLIKYTAKHFFELGLQAQRKSVSIQNIDDVLEEFGVDPYSREAKMLKESYYAALDKLLEQKGE